MLRRLVFSLVVVTAIAALGVLAWPIAGRSWVGRAWAAQERREHGSAVAAAARAGKPPPEPPRVAAARKRRSAELRELFAAAGAPFPPRAVLLRVFKADAALELWAGGAADAPLALVKEFPICAGSGGPGPKRRAGDAQVPEGFYPLTQLNPWSSFHLSIRVGYPNASDRARGGPGDLGGDIMVHGNCVTIGCVPLGDAAIELVYLAVLAAREAGGVTEAHLLPARLEGPRLAALRKLKADDAALLAFWDELEPIDRAFRESHRLPRVRIGKDGRYALAP